MQGKIAVYPGTFDPITHGHLDVIKRGARIFEKLIVAPAVNIQKNPLFSQAEREEMLRDSIAAEKLGNVEVRAFSGMIVDFVRQCGTTILLRGIRTGSDFEAEFQMALTNRELDHEVETVFVMASLEYSYVSSRLIREVAALGGDVSRFVPANVAPRMIEKAKALLGR